MSDERSRSRPVPQDWDLSALSPEEVREIYLRFMDVDPKGGVIRLLGHRYGFLRPEVLVNIQKQLEQTVGASTKGFLYLAGERSAEADQGLSGKLLEGLDAKRLSVEAFRRLADALAIIGYGRFELVASDLGSGEYAFTLRNSPIAEAYGASKKPVCHLLAGFLGGVSRRLLDRDFLCEETACRAQGLEVCRFELRPAPRP